MQAVSGLPVSMAAEPVQFVFTAENFRNPDLPCGLHIVDVPLVEATKESLEGYGVIVEDPEDFTVEKGTFEIVANPTQETGTGDEIYLWMSDYHPDGAQLFWTDKKIPFVVCLGKASHGDDITPQDMRAFYVPAGKGVYFHPGQ